MFLYKRYMLFQAPINCRYNILKRVGFDFDEENRVLVFSTCGSIYGTYNIVNNLITVNSDNFWFKRGSMWVTDEMYTEADAADNFIESLIEKPFVFKLMDDTLIVYYNDQEYQFKELNYQI